MLPGKKNQVASGEEKPDEISKQIPIECAKEINDHLHRPDESVNIGGSINYITRVEDRPITF